MRRATAAERERELRKLGLVLWIVGIALGALLNLVSFAPVLQHAQLFGEVIKVALIAYIPVALYLLVPYVIDRYDPEPWWALAMAFTWGAIFATGLAGFINTGVMKTAGPVAAAVVSAPVFEEAMKGAAVVGMFLFLRREFDGIVDGIIYGAFAGIGFAATENIQYYLQGSVQGHLDDIFVLRGLLTPWIHPLFTAMTGFGVGLARERGDKRSRVLFPLLGYGAAVLLHATWNGVSTAIRIRTMADYIPVVAVGGMFALGFIGIVIALAVRKQRILRKYLGDEVVLGHISQQELDLVCAPFARLKARRWPGGKAFARAGARLAFSKWHVLRANKLGAQTASMDFVAPLREELARMRAAMHGRRPP